MATETNDRDHAQELHLAEKSVEIPPLADPIPPQGPVTPVGPVEPPLFSPEWFKAVILNNQQEAQNLWIQLHQLDDQLAAVPKIPAQKEAVEEQLRNLNSSIATLQQLSALQK